MDLKINRNTSLDSKQLSRYLSAQLNHFFPDENPINENEVFNYVQKADERVWHCFAGIRKKYFNEGNVVHFNHLHSDQYCMYLYMLSNFIHEYDQHVALPTKLYYLNKTLHAVDIYFTTRLPDIFLFVHPLGTILGRAKFSDYFICYQRVTVGCLNEGVFPEFRGKTILYAGASVLGDSKIEDNVCLAAGTLIANQSVPPNKIVFGSSPKIKFSENSRSIFERPPFAYHD